MNRISHFLRAKTQYNLHSPFVYRLYTEVLFSRCPGRGRSAADVVWRLEEYYGLPHSKLQTPNSKLPMASSLLSPTPVHPNGMPSSPVPTGRSLSTFIPAAWLSAAHA